MIMQTEAEQTSTGHTAPRARGRRATAVVVAAVAAVGVWALAAASTDGPRAAMGGTEQLIGAGPVVVTALVSGLAGWAALAAFERWGRAARRRWTVLAVGVLAVSLAGPLTGGVDPVDTVFLLLLHLVVGVVVIVGLRRTTADADVEAA